MKKIISNLTALLALIFSVTAGAETCPPISQFNIIDRSQYDPDPYWSVIQYEIRPPSGWKFEVDPGLIPTKDINFYFTNFIAKKPAGSGTNQLGLRCSYEYRRAAIYGYIDLTPDNSARFQEKDFINHPNWNAQTSGGWRAYWCRSNQVGECSFSAGI